MKKCMMLLGVFVIVLTVVLSTVAFASSGISVVVDGEYVTFDVEPQIINGRTMVPLRAIFESLGAEVVWNNETRTVTAAKEGVTVSASIGSNTMYVNWQERTIDVAPMIVDGRTLVPARFVAEAFACDVHWDAGNKTVYIESVEEVLPMDEYLEMTEEEIYEMNS